MSQIRFNITFTPPPYDDPEWLDIPEQVRESAKIEQPFVFPSLKATCTTLLGDILNRAVPAWDDASYVQDIEQHGGIEAVADNLLTFIRPEIMGLQGKVVTPEVLESVRQRFQPSSGPQVKHYATNNALPADFRVNSFVDVLMGKPLSRLLIHPDGTFGIESRITPGLEHFRGGRYTDGSLENQ
ncbi:hypothetical protein BDW59DRAFT_160771 [Aspergillus cavernicola]|uniref:Uncharacterized protein n=1 Tax=Aspergillus cavernicola TaxID=176166 RepID=A0ABR4IGL5_9EURO